MSLNRRTSATCCAASLAVSAIGGCASSAPTAKGKAWETMDRATLDRAYNNSAAVPESGATFKAWLVRSEKVRADHPEHLNLVYGPRPRDRIDYFSAGNGTPVLIFIHGGFWQMRSKDDFAFLAESFLSSGVSVAMVGYPLAPDATMARSWPTPTKRSASWRNSCPASAATRSASSPRDGRRVATSPRWCSTN